MKQYWLNKKSFSSVLKLSIIFFSVPLFAQETLVAEITGNPADTTGWESAGGVRIVGEEIVLTEAKDGQAGAINYAEPYNLNTCSKWMVEFDFRMAGGTDKIGEEDEKNADGIAFWYLEKPPKSFETGGGIGIPKDGKGLKVVFDTFDNNSATPNPELQVYYGNGYKEDMPNMLRQYIPDIRGEYHHAEILWEDGYITIKIDGTTVLTGRPKPIDEVEDIEKGYFGFSASTGGDNDRHSIKNVKVYTNEIKLKDEAVEITHCDNDSDGFEEFDLTAVKNDISLTGDFSYYTSEQQARDRIDPISNPASFSNTEAYINQIIHVRVDNAARCASFATIELIVNPLEIDLPSMLTCDSSDQTFGDGKGSFDLSSNNDEISGGHLSVFYYETQAAMMNNNPIQNLGSYVSKSRTVLIKVVNNQGCPGYTTLELTVNPNPVIADIPEDIEACASYPVDLTENDLTINPGQKANTKVVYYAGSNNYNNNKPIENPEEFQINTGSQTIIAALVNTETTCTAKTIISFEIWGNPEPQVDLSEYDGLIYCSDKDSDTPTISGNYDPIVIDTGLDENQYSFEWKLDGTSLSETGSSILVNSAGEYTVTVNDITTSKATSCSTTASATIIGSNPPEFEVNIVTASFSGEQKIEITNVTGQGNYEFKIDIGPWTALGNDGTLTLPVVRAGFHMVFGRDKNGCGTTAHKITIIDYPKFMTPNGDGFNDTWNVAGIGDQTNAKIYIFDRYGKLLKQLAPTDLGWDGTYNGKLMPTDDYWFWVEYMEPSTGSLEIFKAHFTLKR